MLAANTVITWSDFATRCLNSIKSVCCNVDSYASNVPAKLKTGQGQVEVWHMDVGKSGSNTYGNIGGDYHTTRWYANATNLISIVAHGTIEFEWNEFLTAAGIDTRSNKVINAKELELVVGLYMQFMSYHIKPIYSRRQVYTTVEAQALFQGCQYIAGTIAPKYTLTGSKAPKDENMISDEDIKTIIGENFKAEELMTHCDNPIIVLRRPEG